MIDSSVARRYAKALFDIAAEKDQTTAYQSELKAVVDALEADRDFNTLLLGRVITIAEKKELVKQVFGAALSGDVLNFLCLILDKGREIMLPEMLAAYTELLDAEAGITPVNVTAAFELSAEQLEELARAFEKKLNSPVRLIPTVDKSLIGGVRAQVGDTVYDGSLLGRLQGLSRRLGK